MTTQFRFIGIEAAITGVASMDRYGQLVTLPEGMKPEAAAACCIPASEFDAIFGGVDYAPYEMVAAHDGAPKEFREAKARAAAALGEFRKTAGGGR